MSILSRIVVKIVFVLVYKGHLPDWDLNLQPQDDCTGALPTVPTMLAASELTIILFWER